MSRIFSNQEIPKNLDSLIQNYFKEEAIDGLECPLCKVKTLWYKKCRIWSYPQTLFIQIKRFVYYPVFKKLKDKVILTDPEINLHRFRQKVKISGKNGYSKNCVVENDQRSGIYQLKGYIEHIGEVNEGHYINYCYGNKEQCWYRYNDSKVAKVTSIREETPFLIGSSEIYILALELKGD
jgi:ubiquitin C-terminal hydrolase